MNSEESTNQGTQEEKTSNGNDGGNKSKAPSLIESADSAAKRLESANSKAEELLKRQEELEARNRLGGRSVSTQTPEKKEDDPKDYAMKALRGKIPLK